MPLIVPGTYRTGVMRSIVVTNTNVPGRVLLTNPAGCSECADPSTVIADAEGVHDWLIGGKFIAAALPALSPEQREVLLSGMHPACFVNAFA